MITREPTEGCIFIIGIMMIAMFSQPLICYILYDCCVELYKIFKQCTRPYYTIPTMDSNTKIEFAEPSHSSV